MRDTVKTNLFEYLDYRKFLRDYYDAQKKSRAGFSLRRFSEKAGFGSSNFYKLVMDGDRNLTEKSALKFAQALDFNKQQSEFFLNLVRFTQAKTHDEKNQCYKKILRSKNFSHLKPMEKNQYEFYSKWYHAVVRELVTSKHFSNNLEELAQKIQPALSRKEVEKSIELLETLGFIQKNPAGGWELCSTLVTTGAESKSVTLMNYHKDLLTLVGQQIEAIPAERRDISALTLGVSREMIHQIKKKIQNFRNEILEYVSNQTNADEVVLLSMQFLPVTQWPEEKQS